MDECMDGICWGICRKKAIQSHTQGNRFTREIIRLCVERRTIDGTVCELFLWMEQMEMLGMGGGKVVI